MAIFLLTLILISIFLFDLKIFIYSLMIYYVSFDMIDGFYDDEKIYAAIRYIIPFCLIIYYLVKKSAFRKSDFIFFLLTLYLIILLVYIHGDIVFSAKYLFALLLTILMIPVGRHIGRHHNFVLDFEYFNRFLLIILPIYIVIVNLFKIGGYYSDAFSTGFLITSRMYIFPIVIFFAINYILNNKGKSKIIRGLDLFLIIINIGILILNTRRTTLGMLFVSLIIYTVYNRKIIFKMVVLSLFFILALTISYPLYKDRLTTQLEQRERIQDIDTYDEEGRVIETISIFDYHSREQNVYQIFFGVKLFDTHEFGMRYFGRDRPIHSDINMIFYSTGLVGLILFLLFFIHYFIFGNKKILNQNKKIYYPLLVMFLLVLFPGRFIGTLTYAPLLMLAMSAVKFQKSDFHTNPFVIKTNSNFTNNNSN